MLHEIVTTVKLIYLFFARLNLIFGYQCFTIISDVIAMTIWYITGFMAVPSTILSNPLAPIAFQICAS
jgi:hypothetical protein